MTNWEHELHELPHWHFGGKGSGIEDSLLDLVKRGIKTATCSWFESYAIEDESIPQVGEKSVILNSADEPGCVIEVVSVEVKPFLDVDAQFAFEEGEGDRSYEYWKTAHENFFTNYGKEIDLVWNSKNQHVVCERFKVLHIFD